MDYSVLDVEFEKFTNYKNYYESHSDKIEALANLGVILQRLEKKVDKHSQNIHKEVSSLDEILRMLSAKQAKPKSDNNSKLFNYSRHRIDVLMKKTNDKLHQKSTYPELDEVKNHTKKKVIDYVEDTIGKNKTLAYLTSLERIFHLGERYLNMKIHVGVLEEVEEQIIDRNYPADISISFWDSYKSDYRDNEELNDYGKALVSREKEINKYYYQDIIDETKDLLSTKRQKCITDGGNASSFLYNSVHRKLSDIIQEGELIAKRPSAQTIKNRINEYLEEKY